MPKKVDLQFLITMPSEKTFLRNRTEEIIRSLIYHGRHFSPTRDAVVIRKAADALEELFCIPELFGELPEADDVFIRKKNISSDDPTK